MKNLFLKLFLWIWMAFVIVAVTLADVVAITRSNETMPARVSLYLPLKRGGPRIFMSAKAKLACSIIFDHIIESESAEPYLLDENWKDVLGRKPSAQAVEFAKAAGKMRLSSANS